MAWYLTDNIVIRPIRATAWFLFSSFMYAALTMTCGVTLFLAKALLKISEFCERNARNGFTAVKPARRTRRLPVHHY